MIIPGMVSATFRGKPAEEIIRLCGEAKLQAVEWSENSHVMPGDEEGSAELYRRTSEAGLAIAAYGSYYRLGQNENPEEVFRRSLDSAAALHAPIIRVWAGDKPSAQVEDPERRKIAKEAALLGKMAAEKGIKVAFEWHRNTLTDTNETAMELLKNAAQENLYCLWQPTTELDMRERMAGLRMLGERERLLNLHIYYWVEDVRRPLSEGVDKWRQYLAQVPRTKDRFGLLEFVMGDTEQQLLEDAHTLRQLLAEFPA